MRIDAAALVGIAAYGRHTFGGKYNLRLGAAGFDDAFDPAFEAETVDDEQIRRGDLGDVTWRWRKDMCVTAGADQRYQLDAVAADPADDVGDDREAGDDIELGDRRHGRRQQRRNERRRQLASADRGMLAAPREIGSAAIAQCQAVRWVRLP